MRPGSHWIDVGTGSGILAVVAAHRGAAEVVAIDIDPDAVAVARETVRRNEVDDRVVLDEATLEEARGVFDGAVVNIVSDYLVSECLSLAAALREGGVLLTSGFERDDLDEVNDVLTHAGFRTVSDIFDGDWALLVLERVKGA